MDTLTPGGQLNVNDMLSSSNGHYTLVMQGDGNLVLYEGWPKSPSAVWASNTEWLQPGLRPTHAVMQGDGNFVLYSASGEPAWDTGTWNHQGCRLVLQDDRNLVVYDPADQPLWASNTNVITGGPITQHKAQSVGTAKTITTDATLYSNGVLVLDIFCQNRNWTSGLRGQVLIVAVDAKGEAIWVSNVIQCPTCCSVPDPSCASSRRITPQETWRPVVAQYTTRLDIYQADEPNFVDLRNRTIEGIKALKDIAKELKDAIGAVFG